MPADNDLPLDKTEKEELEDEELKDLAGGIVCVPPEQVSSEPKRIF